MGHPDLFAKRAFAASTERITHGAITWRDPPEIGLTKVQADGLFVVRNPELLVDLPAPWSAARQHEEILLEIKLAGDHLSLLDIHRAEFRRLARQIQREEDPKAPWEGEEPLWIAAPHIPGTLRRWRTLECIAPGCYRVGPHPFDFLWIAANELPLREELIPFLVARSGRALDEFALWVADHQPLDWVVEMLELLSMSTTVRSDLLERFKRSDDPEIRARQREITQALLSADPELERQIEQRGELRSRLEDRRESLRRVLATRKLEVSAEESARIEACTDLDTLAHWLEKAVVATSTAEALR